MVDNRQYAVHGRTLLREMRYRPPPWSWRCCVFRRVSARLVCLRMHSDRTVQNPDTPCVCVCVIPSTLLPRSRRIALYLFDYSVAAFGIGSCGGITPPVGIGWLYTCRTTNEKRARCVFPTEISFREKLRQRPSGHFYCVVQMDHANRRHDPPTSEVLLTNELNSNKSSTE